MQLAAADRTFIVDMLHICRPKDDGAMGGFSPGLTNTEALLEEALGGVLSSPRVVKVGLGPKVTCTGKGMYSGLVKATTDKNLGTSLFRMLSSETWRVL